jgi:ribulose 1,5-bisphosphate synthetase/thiazole synthase
MVAEKSKKNSKAETLKADLAVIGGGASGLAAAVAGAEKGARITPSPGFMREARTQEAGKEMTTA